MLRILLVFMLCLPLSCQKSNVENTIQKPQLAKITIAFTYQPQSTLVHVALALGYFKEEGLEVKSILHTYGKAALQSVLDKKADFATVAETPIMFNILNGEKIFVIANIESSNVNNAIIARKDSGIIIQSKLKGKRIGFTPGTTSDFFLDSFLTGSGLTRKDIIPVGLKPEEMQDAILNKKVDAVSTWNYPLIQISHALGKNGIIYYDREIYTETFNIAAMQEYIQKNPEITKSLLRALIKAENLIVKNPEQAMKIMSAATNVDIKLIKEVWSAFNYKVVLDQTLILTLEDESRWALKNKLTDISVVPNFSNYIHADSLKAVKPEAVK